MQRLLQNRLECLSLKSFYRTIIILLSKGEKNFTREKHSSLLSSNHQVLMLVDKVIKVLHILTNDKAEAK
jgi:hypothetical protein